jgi:hypothetical protein
MSTGASVTVVLTLEGEGASADQLRDLRRWLLRENELRCRVALREAPPAPGELGLGLDALIILAGVRTARTFAPVLIEWLRSRRGNIRLVVTTENGAKVELEADRVRARDMTDLAELIERASGQEPD